MVLLNTIKIPNYDNNTNSLFWYALDKDLNTIYTNTCTIGKEISLINNKKNKKKNESSSQPNYNYFIINNDNNDFSEIKYTKKLASIGITNNNDKIKSYYGLELNLREKMFMSVNLTTFPILIVENNTVYYLNRSNTNLNIKISDLYFDYITAKNNKSKNTGIMIGFSAIAKFKNNNKKKIRYTIKAYVDNNNKNIQKKYPKFQINFIPNYDFKGFIDLYAQSNSALLFNSSRKNREIVIKKGNIFIDNYTYPEYVDY